MTLLKADYIRNQLDHFLREVHQEAQRRRAEEVTVDLRQLEFMNSSCLKCLLWWVSTVQEQPTEGKYRIVFLSSPSVYWQRRSLDALACLAGDDPERYRAMGREFPKE